MKRCHQPNVGPFPRLQATSLGSTSMPHTVIRIRVRVNLAEAFARQNVDFYTLILSILHFRKRQERDVLIKCLIAK